MRNKALWSKCRQWVRAGQVVTLCALAGLVAGAHGAMHLSQDGIGQILYFPIYSVQGGYDTLFSLTNAAPSAKLVAVRFYDAKNSRVVQAFHVFLGPYDVWTAALSKLPNGGAQIKTNDFTCTYPAIPAAGLAFKTSNFTEGFDASIERTAVGFIEVIEAATVKAGSSTEANLLPTNGVPRNCGALVAAYSALGEPTTGPSSPVAQLSSTDFLQPRGEIGGSISLISVASGVEFSADPVAVQGAFDAPQLHIPERSATTIENASRSITLNHDGNVYAAIFEDGFDALSALFQRISAIHDWIVDPSLNAGTDLVTTFPTRRFFSAKVSGGFTRTPFSSEYSASGAKEPFGPKFFDREQRTNTSTIEFPILPPAVATALTHSATILTVRNSNVLGGSAGSRYGERGNEGFMAMLFTRRTEPPLEIRYPDLPVSVEVDARRVIRSKGIASVNGVRCAVLAFRGLPIIGLTAHRYVNSNIGGVLSNYGAFNVPRYERTITCE